MQNLPHLATLLTQSNPEVSLQKIHEIFTDCSTSELLALLIAPSIPKRKHYHQASRFLASEGSLFEILVQGPAFTNEANLLLETHQYYKILASAELNRRMLLEDLRQKTLLNDVATVKKFCITQLGGKMVECCLGLFLNAQHQLLDCAILAEGTIDQAAIFPREILKHALKVHSTSIIIAHNHPSGSTKPSQSDILFTNNLKQALQLIDINLLDHIIVGNNQAYSFAENRLLSEE